MRGYRIIYSDRKTLALAIKDGEVIVRAPRRISRAHIDSFVISHRKWMEKRLARYEAIREELECIEALSENEIEELKERARKAIPPIVERYAALFDVTYGRITVRCQRTRWGSCNAKGDLSFNCLLLLAPKEAMESVIAHELCHRKHMDHSEGFYDELLKVFPEYKKWYFWLRENGERLIRHIA